MKKTLFLLICLCLPFMFSCSKPEEEEELEDLESLCPDGALPGLFSVSPERKVWFSKGNLQYQPFSNTWHFAEEQFSLIAESDVVFSQHYIGMIDLFGWGTSGYCGMSPLMFSTEDEVYGNGESDIAQTNYDWGVCNRIVNAGDEANLWRTLTAEEWRYLLSGRLHADNKYGLATVDGVYGLVVLPDMALLHNVRFVAGTSHGFATNVYSVSQWRNMEASGVLFLPASGYRSGSQFSGSGETGGYWAGSCFSSIYAYDLFFDGSSVYPFFASRRSYGRSVRLVQDQ